MKPIKVAAVSLFCIALTACVSNSTKPSEGAATTPPPPEDTRACAKNFAVEGSAMSMSGKSYQNKMKIAGVTKKTAIERASKAIALEGMTIAAVDKDAGLISASNQVTMGKGATAPFTVGVEQEKSGVDVTMRFRTAFGQSASDSTVKDFFCKIANAIEAK